MALQYGCVLGGPDTLGSWPRPEAPCLPVPQLEFITIFLVAFLLMPLFSPANNGAEISLDATVSCVSTAASGAKARGVGHLSAPARGHDQPVPW